MNFEPDFPFIFLQSTGTSGGAKVLSAPNLSTHFQWNAQHVVSLAGQGAIYILAKKNLHIPVSNTSLKLLYKLFQCIIFRH